ncbi:hypothetical protein IAU60_005443 [Kwoniella sp. DSM 27419]
MNESRYTESFGHDLETKAEIERQGDHGTVFGDKSPGVARIEAISSCLTSWHRYVLFITIFLVASQVSTVTVVRSIVAAAAQPVYAKISDYFGRVSILLISIVFYLVVLVEVLIADTTSLRSRLFFSYIPATPFIINAWVSGDIAQAVLTHSTWNWGMWAIIFPVTTIPLLVSLLHAQYRAKQKGLLVNIPSPFKAIVTPALWSEIFWQIDIIGLLLLAATFALILLPLTLAGGVRSVWGTARVIAPLVVGFVVALPGFIIWELKIAKHPAVPFRLLKDRMVLAPLLIAVFLNTAWYTQGDYLDIKSATRIQNIYSFCSVVVGVILGLVIRRVRRLKWFIVAGTLLFVLAFGLLIRYRGGYSTSDLAGLIGAEVILGIAGGLFPYPAQVMIQSAVQHERTAIVTSLYLASYSIGSALGNTFAALVWYGVADGATLAANVFASPLTFIAAYPPGTPAREAAGHAYREVQRYLTIMGICISIILVIAALCLKNPRLGDEQSFAEAEGFHVLHAGKQAQSDASSPGYAPSEGERGTHQPREKVARSGGDQADRPT